MLEPSEELSETFDNAVELAKSLRHEYITIEHVLYSFFMKPQNAHILRRCLIDTDKISEELKNYIETELKSFEDNSGNVIYPRKTNLVDRVINRAFAQAMFGGKLQVDYLDLFQSILREKKSFSYHVLTNAGVTNHLLSVTEGLGESYAQEDSKNTSEKILEKYTTNLNERVSENKILPVIAREDELEKIAICLGRKSKNNVILVGDPGVGKTCIAEGLAYNIVKGVVPKFLREYTIYSLDLTAMLAGTKFRGDFEERFKEIIVALQSVSKSILFIDEAHMMNGAGSGTTQNANDFANMIKPSLGSDDIKVIASTTWDEYRKYFEKDRALIRRFQRIVVNEPSVEVSIKILNQTKQYYEDFHNIKIPNDSVEEAVKLSHTYQKDKKLPDKAFDLIDITCSRAKIKNRKKKSITREDIQAELSNILGMKIEVTDKKDKNVYEHLSANIKKYIFGQDDAVDQITDKILMYKAGLQEENKPVGSFVFMGPSGVGKTELARQLSNSLGVKLMRFDMSEYMEKHAVSKLIGSPPGYVGYDNDAGKLITSIQENPNGILLFDEIEKAHPEVSNILLQLMDNGRITGANGKEADATNTIVILTTNLGAQQSEKNPLGFTAIKDGYDDRDLKIFFSPEFRNRLDGVITFRSLTKDVMIKIIDNLVKALNKKLQDKSITLSITDNARDFLMEKGFDPVMGARPLKRAIDTHINKKLSKEILFGKLGAGGNVKVDVADSEIVFHIN